MLAIQAPAKINLTLSVTGRDEAGYHKLVSAVGFTDFSDKLHIQQKTDDKQGQDKVKITGPFAQELANAGGDSLLAGALTLARDKASDYGYEPIASHNLTLDKQIPLGGGLGGGSADAAAYLRHLSKDWSQTDKQYLKEASVALGADVPACFDNHCHIMAGIGERAHYQQLDTDKFPWMVITNPSCHADTTSVFQAFADSSQTFTTIKPSDLLTLISDNRWAEMLAIGNDLTKAACHLYPQIANLLEVMSDKGLRLGSDFIGHSMSGSGASCFALLKDEAAAKAYHDYVADTGVWSVVTRFF